MLLKINNKMEESPENFMRILKISEPQVTPYFIELLSDSLPRKKPTNKRITIQLDLRNNGNL